MAAPTMYLMRMEAEGEDRLLGAATDFEPLSDILNWVSQPSQGLKRSEAFLVGNVAERFFQPNGIKKLSIEVRAGRIDYATLGAIGVAPTVMGQPGLVVILEKTLQLGGGFVEAWLGSGNTQALQELIAIATDSLEDEFPEPVILQGRKAIEALLDKSADAIEKSGKLNEFSQILSTFGCTWTEWRRGKRRLLTRLGLHWPSTEVIS